MFYKRSMKKFLISALLISLMSMTGCTVDIVAHRGDNQFAPMNTVEAAKHAWFNGIKYVESDFYETNDKTIVGAHCNRTIRMLSGDDSLDIKNLTEQACKNINLANNPKEQKKGYKFVKLPTLDEFLWAMPPDAVLVFEAKNFSNTYADNVEKAFKRTNTNLNQIVFISFREDACQGLKKKFPQCKVYLLLGGGKVKKGADWAIAKCKELGVDGVDVCYKLDKEGNLVSAEYADKIKDAGLGFWMWTVNRKEDFLYCKRIGAETITTDFATAFKPLR